MGLKAISGKEGLPGGSPWAYLGIHTLDWNHSTGIRVPEQMCRCPLERNVEERGNELTKN